MKNERRWYRHSLCASLAVALACLAGCSSAIRPKNLPPELQAPPPNDVQNVDLTRLTSFAVSKDLVQPGDVLEVTILSGYTEGHPLTSPVRVKDNGWASVPFVGDVEVAGLDLTGAQQAIRTAAVTRNVYRDPHVTVTMKQKKTNRVTVLGPGVERPGTFELQAGSSDLLAAIVAAGGLTPEANSDIEIRRPGQYVNVQTPSGRPDKLAEQFPGQQVAFNQPVYQPPQSTRVNLISASQSGQGTPLSDGDVVMVGRRDPEPIHVLGLVKKPGKYELPANKELHVLDAVALAGGLDSSVANKIYVIRRVPGATEAKVIQVGLNKAKFDAQENILLAAGDVVSVEQTLATAGLDIFQKFVRIAVGGTLRLY